MYRIVFIAFLLFGCSTSSEKNSVIITTEQLDYAKGFHFEKDNEHEYLVIDKPWPGASKTLRYNLNELPKTFICTSTTHLPFFEMLDSEESVIGFPNVKYISSKVFVDRSERGLLKDLGPDDNINLELLIGTNPDAVIAFDMGSESKSLDKIKESGIPIYYNSDFLEESPLGRAEWIKFFGALLNKKEKADSIFKEIETNYLKLKQSVTNTDKPSILSGIVYGDTWFLPGGNNWAATFYRDAGGEYLWDQDTTSGWLELSFESVYNTANNANFWIGTGTLNSRDELIGQDGRYASFSSYEADNVFNYNKIIGPNGGYDFFESGYSRPDLVLSDLIKILHPEVLPNYETVYFQKLP